jgi:hypothetical protein
VLILLLRITSEGVLAAIAISGWRELRRRGARGWAHIALVATWLVASLEGPVVWAERVELPVWLAISALLPLVAASFLPGLLVRLTGGQRTAFALASASHRIARRWEAIAQADEPKDADAVWLMARSDELNKWRAPETNELIDLYQAKIADALAQAGDSEGFTARAAARNQRIHELTEELDAYLARRRSFLPRGMRTRR